MAGSEHRLDRLMLELEQVVLRGDPWLEEAKSCLGWLDANFGTVRWTSFLNEGDAEGGGGADVGRITNCSGILERAVDLLQALDSCSGYLEAGLAIARRNGGAVDPEHAVMLLKKTDWCKATRDRNTRKNFSRRLLDSGLFREDRTSGLLLLIEVHGLRRWRRAMLAQPTADRMALRRVVMRRTVWQTFPAGFTMAWSSGASARPRTVGECREVRANSA